MDSPSDCPPCDILLLAPTSTLQEQVPLLSEHHSSLVVAKFCHSTKQPPFKSSPSPLSPPSPQSSDPSCLYCRVTVSHHTLLLGSIIYVRLFGADLSGLLSGLVCCQPSFGLLLEALAEGYKCICTKSQPIFQALPMCYVLAGTRTWFKGSG